VCLTFLTTIFQLYLGGQLYWWWKPEYSEKTIDLPHVTDKLYFGYPVQAVGSQKLLNYLDIQSFRSLNIPDDGYSRHAPCALN
jgi:hypothetical protein